MTENDRIIALLEEIRDHEQAWKEETRTYLRRSLHLQEEMLRRQVKVLSLAKRVVVAAAVVAFAALVYLALVALLA